MGGFKFKNRYLVCQITFKDGRGLSSTPSVLLKALRDSLGELFGDVGRGASLASCQIKYVHDPSGIFLIRCGRDMYRHVWLALTCIKSIEMRLCRCDVLRCSGSLSSSLAGLQEEVGVDISSSLAHIVE